MHGIYTSRIDKHNAKQGVANFKKKSAVTEKVNKVRVSVVIKFVLSRAPFTAEQFRNVHLTVAGRYTSLWNSVIKMFDGSLNCWSKLIK